MYLFGEVATSHDRGYALINGLLTSLSSQVSLILLHRDYQPDYHSFFNQAVAESSNAVNEKGFYTGLSITPSRSTEWIFYADVFRFPWLRFRVDAPSNGYELLSQFNHSVSKKTRISLRYKLESKQENDALDNVRNVLEDVRRQNYRLEISQKVTESVHLRNRIELVQYRKAQKNETGSIMFQDVIYNPLRSRFSGNFRFALFDTPGFNSRIYAFENDVLYSYSVPAYQNRGIRFYLNGRYAPSRTTDIYLRYAISSYTDLNSIGSGLDEIQGNKKSDIRLQIRFQF
jgi:hypothetical protein